MEHLKSVAVFDGQKERLISVYAGDLARIPADQAVDLLVVSAFPNNYQPRPETLIGALQQNGLSVAELAADKDQDLRKLSGFWLSKPLGERYPGMHIGRLACFEPLVLGQPPQVVGELFRGLFPFLDQERDAVVAMPLLGAGNQRWPPGAIFQPLVEAAYHWLQRGMPIAELRIVEIQAQRALAIAEQLAEFEQALFAGAAAVPRSTPPAAPEHSPDVWPAGPPPLTELPAELPDLAPPTPVPVGARYDVFLSYAEEDQDAAQRLAGALQSELGGIRVFDYRLSIDVGKSWQQEIDDAIEDCKKIVALLSADYFASPECQEELMIARLRNKRSNFEVFFPLYWKDAGQALALWLQAITYSDCREGDPAKLAQVTKRLAAQLR
jgi:hypothetical protein